MVLEVIVDISNSEVDRCFDYLGEDIPLGSRVVVEFGRKRLIGFVVGKKEKSDYDKLKTAQYLDTPILPEQLELMNYMRHQYNLRYIDVLRLFVPAKLRDEKSPQSTRIFLSLIKDKSLDEIKASIAKNASKQIEAVEYLSEGNGEFLTILAEKFGVSSINSLRKKGLLQEENIHTRVVPLSALKREDKHVNLTKTQLNAVEKITKGKGVFLLHGVTGSGKTEVYEAVIDNMLEMGKTAIMLVPEISLTPQMLGIFRARFGDKVAILHSGLNASERYDEWKRLKDGEAQIAIGARSAVFAPVKNLGAIFIDEEHDTSYISESNPRYDTKDIAKFRTKISNAVLVLGSATPDMETYLKATEGEYQLIEMPERISKHKLPDMEIIDMTMEFRQGNRSILSKTLQDAIEETLKRGEQVMLFLNRRGFASFIRCNKCGYIPKCEDCDVSLTYHKSTEELKCHYCGKRYHALTRCPKCGSDSIRHGRVGTETVVEELHKLFGDDIKTLRMDNDTITGKDSYFKIIDAFAKHKADILVGTQMIAKGHDFSNVTLVGILEADAALYFSDYRSAERTFQLITQVAGRAGRADKKGRVILQTYAPRNYVFHYGKDYNYRGFFEKEINTRMITKFPPFSKIVRVLCTSDDEQIVVDEAREIYKQIMDLQGKYGKFIYLGASKSPVTKMNGQIRYQVLCRLDPRVFEYAIQDIYKIADANRNKKGSVFVEINPQSLI